MSEARHRSFFDPVLIMLAVILLAAVATHLLSAGHFQRHGKLIVAGTYHVMPKVDGLPAILAPTAAKPEDKPARAAGFVSVATSIPAGLAKSAELIFMLLIVGGMFGVMRITGAIDAGLDRLVHYTAGNVYTLTAALMVLLSLGSTFLGFISEYLVLIPIVGLLGRRLGLPNLFAVAVVGVAAKIGYAASVTNPVALAVAQPLVGAPLFSGVPERFAVFVVMLAIGMGWVFLWLRRVRRAAPAETTAHPDTRLSLRQGLVLLTLLAGGVGLVCGATLYRWGNAELSAYYVCLSIVMAAVGGLGAVQTADAFVEGMKSMVLAGLLVGLASSVEVLLRSSQVLDTVVAGLSAALAGQSTPVVAMGLMGVESILDVLVPSVSGKAAMSLPILWPIAQLSGVNGATVVMAFLFGGGLTNMITPTSGMLLAYLASAKVNFREWLGFVLPLVAILAAVAIAALAVVPIFMPKEPLPATSAGSPGGVSAAPVK